MLPQRQETQHEAQKNARLCRSTDRCEEKESKTSGLESARVTNRNVLR